MLNPSYSQLIDAMNEKIEGENVITSRYSVIIAAAKRARQITDGAEYDKKAIKSDKAVSIAISELSRGILKIIPASEEDIVAIPDIPLVLPTLIDDSYIQDGEILDDFEDDDEEKESIIYKDDDEDYVEPEDGSYKSEEHEQYTEDDLDEDEE